MDEGTQAPRSTDPKDRLVLLVDDDESILDLLDHIVKKEGFRVERASDGPEAVRKVTALNPDLIVLDFMLPGMGGFEVLKELQMGETRTIPVLVITGRKIDRQTVDILLQEANVKQFLEKPIKPAVLATSLHKILGTQPPEIRRTVDRGPLSSGW